MRILPFLVVYGNNLSRQYLREKLDYQVPRFKEKDHRLSLRNNKKQVSNTQKWQSLVGKAKWMPKVKPDQKYLVGK